MLEVSFSIDLKILHDDPCDVTESLFTHFPRAMITPICILELEGSICPISGRFPFHVHKVSID